MGTEKYSYTINGAIDRGFPCRCQLIHMDTPVFVDQQKLTSTLYGHWMLSRGFTKMVSQGNLCHQKALMMKSQLEKRIQNFT